MESIEKRIKFFESVLKQDLVENRCEEVEYGSKFIIGSNFAKMEGIVIGAVVPKEDMCNLDYYYGNVGIITLDLLIEKDLNNDKLRFRINGNRLRLYDMESFNEEEYVENYVEEFGYEEKYRLCEQYDCSPSELVSELIKNEDIRDIIGDCGIVNVNDNDYLVMFDSGWDLYSIIKDIRENEKIMWFGKPIELLETIRKYAYSYSNELGDLTKNDLYEIGITINKICEEQNILSKIIDYTKEN